MANVVEIVVTGKNLTKPEFDKAVADARAAGRRAGDELSKGMGEQVSKELPPKIKEPLAKAPEPAKESGVKAGAAFARAFGDQVGPRLDPVMGLRGTEAGSSFSAKFSESARKGVTSGGLAAALGPAGVEALAKTQGDKAGFDFTDAMGGRVRGELPEEVEKPLEESGKRGGEKAGKAAAGAISPLIAGAFTAAATVGPAALLGATALAVTGAAALVTKGNTVLLASYQKLGAHAANAVRQAAQPLLPEIQDSIGILDHGIAVIAPELKGVFSAVAPDVTALTGGLVSLVSNTLPGMASGLRAMAPFAQDLAVDFGKIGSGLGALFQGLGSGASGGVAGFNALADVLKELLGDIGTIAGSLANGLGPALRDVADVALPVAHALTGFVAAIPPGAIRAAADATLALFAAFKIGTLVGVVREGASFLSFLRGAAIAEDAAAASASAWGAAMDAIPLVAVAAAVGGLAVAADKLGGTGDHTSVSIDKFTGSLLDAAQGSRGAQDEVVKLATAVALMSDRMGSSLQGLKDVDTSLSNLYQSNPGAAAREFDAITVSLQAQGQSAGKIAQEFPQYTKAVNDAALAAREQSLAATGAAQAQDGFTTALAAAAGAAGDSAQQSSTATVAALGLTDGTSNLATSLYNALNAFAGASGAASAYKSSLDALYNKYADYSQAQATFTERLNSAAKALTYGKDAVDLNSEAGAKNFTMLHRLADANEQVAQSFINQGGSVQDADKKLQAGALAIDNMARKAGFSASQVAQLNTELYGTANIKDIHVSVGADTSAAFNAVNNTLRYIDNQVAYIQVQTVGGSTGGHQLLASGGIAGGHAQFAAAGGPRSGFTWVGEHGPELIPLPAGTRVHSNPDSMRMAAEASGGGGRVVLEVAPGGASAFEQFMVEALRKWVRARAGNAANSVQKAFGQSF